MVYFPPSFGRNATTEIKTLKMIISMTYYYVMPHKVYQTLVLQYNLSWPKNIISKVGCRCCLCKNYCNVQIHSCGPNKKFISKNTKKSLPISNMSYIKTRVLSQLGGHKSSFLVTKDKLNNFPAKREVGPSVIV